MSRAAALLLLLMALARAAQAEAPRVTRVAPLLGPWVRLETAYPLAVDVRGGDAGFDGHVELSWGPQTLARRLTLGAGAEARLWFMPLAADESLRAQVRLRPLGGPAGAPVPWRRAAEQVYPVGRLVGLVGVAPAQQEHYFAHLQTPSSIDGDLRFIALPELPDDPAGLAPFDLLVIGEQTRLSADGPQARAVFAWLRAGGAALLVSQRVGEAAPWRTLFPDGPPRWPLGDLLPPPDKARNGFVRQAGGKGVLYRFGHGSGRGVLLARDILTSEYADWPGTPRLWSYLATELLAGARPTSPATLAGADRMFPGSAVRPSLRADVHRAGWLLLVAIATASLLVAALSRRPLLSAAVALVVSVAGSALLAARLLPAGSLTADGLALLELTPDATAGRLQSWVRVRAERAQQATLTVETAWPRVLSRRAATLTESARARWQLPLALARGGSRRLTWTAASPALGPLRRAGDFLLNPGTRRLAPVVLIDGDRGWTLGALDPGGHCPLTPTAAALDLDALGAVLLPESPEPGPTLRFLLAARRLPGRRWVAARLDLPLTEIAGATLRPPDPLRTVVLLPLER